MTLLNIRFMKCRLSKPTSYRHIALSVVLCCFIGMLHSQKIVPGQLRKEVLQSQKPQKPEPTPKKGRRHAAFGEPTPINKPLAPIISPFDLKGVSLVYLENCETLSYDELINPNVKVLRGNVRFRHDNALMYCDSAYFYEKANSLDAFGHVKIVQGDTVFVYGDVLYYDGNIKLARMRYNVRMENRKTLLTTDSLNYDRITNLAYYYTGGTITDPLNKLTSTWGQYSTRTNDAFFKQNVRLTNKDFWLQADSLRYNTRTHIANMIGKTHVRYNDETDIYTTRGWYNTETDRSMLLNRSIVVHKDGKTMTGDTIFYDKTKKYGEGYMKVVMVDSVQRTTLKGNYTYYSDKDKIGVATDSAMMVDWSSKDTMYLHADTLYTYKDSIYNAARGHYNVRIFRTDVQGICDSLTYTARDSVLYLHRDPVLWAENNQLSGENIKVITKNKKVNRVDIQKAAMAIQHNDSVYYNQMSGKEIIAFVDSGQVRRVNVNGNAETAYYPVDDKDTTLVGLNKTESSFVVMYLKNKKIDKVVLTSVSNGTMYPMPDLKTEQLYLKNFFWIDDQRPKNPRDVFTHYPKTKRIMPGRDNPGKEDSKKASAAGRQAAPPAEMKMDGPPPRK